MTLSVRRSLSLCLLALLLAACGKEDSSKQGGPGGWGGGIPVPVVVETVREQGWTDALRALGTVHAREAVTVTAKVSETVQQVHFESGQQVARGAPLVTLSGQQQQASLASAEAALKEAEQLYQRQDQLAKQQLIARASLDAQRATRDAARAQVAQIRANLSDRVIRAPFAGVLGIRQVSPGALVTPGTAIATLDDIARVYVDFPVPETELGDVGPGQALAGHVSTYGDRRFDGTVSAVSARLDAVSRSATVRGDFPNADGALKPGMLVNVRLAMEPRLSLSIPERALVPVGSKAFVFTIGDGKAKRTEVKTGRRKPGYLEIISGVAEGQTIIADGIVGLQDGMAVKVMGEFAGPVKAFNPEQDGK